LADNPKFLSVSVLKAGFLLAATYLKIVKLP
jgi:hypothetical protein